MPREFTVTPSALDDARNIRMGGDPEKRLVRMARRSAPMTHEAGNRRFLDFILQVEGQSITGVSRLDYSPSQV